MACGKRQLIKAEADFILARARARAQEGKAGKRWPIRSYYCRRCKAYHTTSQPMAWTNKEKGPDSTGGEGDRESGPGGRVTA
jgi:hypothetical protein